MRLIAWLALALPLAGEPVTVETRRGNRPWSPGGWIVPVKIGGREKLFGIFPSLPRTVVVATRGTYADRTVEIGGRAVAEAIEFPYRDKLEYPDYEIAGFLGQDFLARYALGFDPGANTLTLWEGGAPDPEGWVGGGAARTALGRSPEGTPTVEAIWHGRPVTWALDAQALSPSVRKDLVSGTDADFGREEDDLHRVSNEGLVRYRVDDEPEPGTDGVWPVGLGFEGRFVFDVPRGALVGRAETRDEAIVRFLSDFAGFRLRIEGDLLRVAAPTPGLRPRLADGIAKRTGLEVYALADRDAAHVLARLRGDDPVSMIRLLGEDAGKRRRTLLWTTPEKKELYEWWTEGF